MALPHALGGLQSDPETIVSTVQEISRADGSTGWNTLIAGTNAFLAWLEPWAAEELLAEVGSTAPLMAGSTAPAGSSTVEDGGRLFKVTGRWAFCSGISGADVMMAGFRADGPADSPMLERARVAFVPARDAVVHDTWHTMGLQGTGSHDVELSGAVVPSSRVVALSTARSHHDGPLFRLTPYNVLMVLLAGFPLGVTRRALDEFTAQAGAKTRPGASTSLLESPRTVSTVMRAETALRAARSLVDDVFGEVWEVLSDGREPSGAQRASIAAATVHAMETGRGITGELVRLAGTSALHLDNPLQRCLRDLQAGGQHFAFSPDLRSAYGRTFLGLTAPPALFHV